MTNMVSEALLNETLSESSSSSVPAYMDDGISQEVSVKDPQEVVMSDDPLGLLVDEHVPVETDPFGLRADDQFVNPSHPTYDPYHPSNVIDLVSDSEEEEEDEFTFNSPKLLGKKRGNDSNSDSF